MSPSPTPGDVTPNRALDALQPPTMETRAFLPVIDVLRGITILWVALFHLYVDTRGIPGSDATASGTLAALLSGAIVRTLALAVDSLAGLPSFRVDLFLFVTGFVLMLSHRTRASAFLSRRLKAVLPSYWLGSLLVLGVILILAGVRAAIVGSPFGFEVQRGSILARLHYLVEPLDIIRSFSIVGRFESPRTMQVVAPSMWYVVLVLQAYCVFPLLRALLSRLGPVRFFLAALAFTWLGRWLEFRYSFVPGFDPNAAVIYFLPFRLLPLALGMVASRWAPALRATPRRAVALALAGPAIVVVLAAVWASDYSNSPRALIGVVGPTAPLVLALPGLWAIAAAASALPALRRLLTWTGRHSIAILVVQDPLRFAVGTALALGIRLGESTWWIAPGYIAASLLLAWAWSPVPTWVSNRLWPPASAVLRPAAGDDAGG
jgi:peptidoglycan/LPS O-acetylase OafA/YrhL